MCVCAGGVRCGLKRRRSGSFEWWTPDGAVKVVAHRPPPSRAASESCLSFREQKLDLTGEDGLDSEYIQSAPAAACCVAGPNLGQLPI